MLKNLQLWQFFLTLKNTEFRAAEGASFYVKNVVIVHDMQWLSHADLWQLRDTMWSHFSLQLPHEMVTRVSLVKRSISSSNNEIFPQKADLPAVSTQNNRKINPQVISKRRRVGGRWKSWRIVAESPQFRVWENEQKQRHQRIKIEN